MAARNALLAKLIGHVIYKLRFSICLALLCLSFLYMMERNASFQKAGDFTEDDFMKLEYLGNGKEIFRTAAMTLPTNSGTHNFRAGIPLCARYPRRLTGKFSEDIGYIPLNTWSEIRGRNPDVSHGGRYAPENCKPRHKVAIIIPFRSRDFHLRILLSHMHPIWQRQDIEYQVYVITQVQGALFNRAKLLNIGVSEARKNGRYDCYIFQDVDLLLEDDRCLYWCHKLNPRHVSMHLDKYAYEPLTYSAYCHKHPGNQTMFQKLFQVLDLLPNVTYFGGVSMLTDKQFDRVNGLSNLYWGWGGEDDDLFMRLKNKGYSVANPYGRKCSFRMIPHERESQNAENLGRYALLRYAEMRMTKDGFSTLRYQILSRVQYPLYTNITVDVGTPSKNMMDFISQSSHDTLACSLKVPWMI